MKRISCITIFFLGILFCIDINAAENFAKMNKGFNDILIKLSEQNDFFTKWDKYLDENTGFDNKDYIDMLTYYMNTFNKVLTAYEEQIEKLNALEKNYSVQWLKNLKKQYSTKELKKRRSEIRDILIYLKYKSEDKIILAGQKDILYYGLAYLDLQKDFFNHFLTYYSTVPESQKDAYSHLYNLIKTYVDKISTQNYRLFITFNKTNPLSRTKVHFLEKQDIFVLMRADEFFKQPFDLMKAIDELNSL